jgi:hypothetical protein
MSGEPKRRKSAPCQLSTRVTHNLWADPTLLAFDPAANSYRSIAAGESLVAGQGYWAYFDAPALAPLADRPWRFQS